MGKKWYGQRNNPVLCPVPDCGHVGSFISKVHCRRVHGMEREEVGEKYGYPKEITRRGSWAFRKESEF